MEKNAELRWPAFVQLFLLIIQVIYLILFFGDFGGFINLALHYNMMLLLPLATSILAFVAYWIGFFKNTLPQRILFAGLFLLHLAVASYSFYITLATLVSRC